MQPPKDADILVKAQEWGVVGTGLVALFWVATKVPAITQKWIPGVAGWIKERVKTREQREQEVAEKHAAEIEKMREELKASNAARFEDLEARLRTAEGQWNYWQEVAMQSLKGERAKAVREVKRRVENGSLPGININEISEPEDDDEAPDTTE